MDAELKKFEEDLERLAPRRLPEGYLSRLEAAMEDWENREEKVVPFPSRTGERGLGRAGFWKAVAAVAVLGAVLALVVPRAPDQEIATAEPAPPAAAGSPLLGGISPVAFSPQDAQRTLVNAADQGVVLTRDARPHRVLRVEAVDRYTFENARGEVLTMERPRVEYVLIPLETD